MIYWISQEQLLLSSEIQNLSVEESLQRLSSLPVIGIDTETTGLDCHNDSLLSVQLGNYENQYVIDCTTVDIQNYKNLLEDPAKTFVFWNAKFDLKWLFQNKIVPHKIYDGFLAEKLMWLGYPAGMHSFSLKHAAWEYLNVDMSKAAREDIIKRKSLNTFSIIYSALDVKYLEQIKNAQYDKLKEKELLTAIEYENRFVLPLSYMEWGGVKVDIDKWKAKMKKDNARLSQAKEALDSWLINNMPDSPYIYVDLQGDLFNGYNTDPQVSINWNSQTQVIPVLESLGIELTVKDKKTGGYKKSLDSKVLKPQKAKSEIIPLLLEYKEAVKVTSTYGENFLKQLDSKTGRLYSNFQQMGADTTRLTSGGKDKNAGKEYINLLNLPADAETRGCFVAEEGNKWISMDYSGQESALLASIADDPLMLKELNEGDGDIHSLVASLVFEDELKGVPLKDVKKVSKESAHNGGVNYRQVAKGYEFLVAYGGNADTIKSNYGKTEEEANLIYNRYMNGLTGVQKYQSFCRRDVMDKGYILINLKTGHKAYIWDFEELCNIKKSFTPAFWEYYREMKVSNPMCDSVQKVRKYFKRKSECEKTSINYRIQGTGSMCLRVSLINFFEFLRKKDWLYKVFITITPYDEINCEAPAGIATEVKDALYKCMTKAGAYFCTKCRLDADISWDKDSEGNEIVGQLPTYWIH